MTTGVINRNGSSLIGPESFTWIQTRDGSPTLWHQLEGASFRSQKGAFTESWAVFVEPALKFMESQNLKSTHGPRVMELGLGPGTNWLLWNLSNPSPTVEGYVAIEQDASSFEMGFAFWIKNIAAILELVEFQQGASRALAMPWMRDEKLATRRLNEAREKLVIAASLDEALALNVKTHLWFHDPFGFDVNPEAYSAEFLQRCLTMWQTPFMGLSYACNSQFQRDLQSMSQGQVRCSPVSTGDRGLKRERLEFFRQD